MRKAAFLLTILVVTPLLADLRSDIRSASGWVAYQVPIVQGRHTVCSWDSVTTIGEPWDTPASALIVLIHVSGGEIDNVRISSPECRATHAAKWLGPVDSAASRRLLLELIGHERVGKKVVNALALHLDAESDLIDLARNHRDSHIRSSALFWVGTRAGDRAAATLRNAVDNDPDASVRAKAVFGIAQMPNERSVPILIELLKTHRNREVRKKAAFWLSQKDDPRALKAFEEILRK